MEQTVALVDRLGRVARDRGRAATRRGRADDGDVPRDVPVAGQAGVLALPQEDLGVGTGRHGDRVGAGHGVRPISGQVSKQCDGVERGSKNQRQKPPGIDVPGSGSGHGTRGGSRW